MGVYQECFRKGELVETMRTGMVTLLYKKGPKGALGNWNHFVDHGLQSVGKSLDRET